MFVNEAFLLKAVTDNRTDQKWSIAKKELCAYGVLHEVANAKEFTISHFQFGL